MVRGKVVIKNPTGLHLKPAGTLCNAAMNYSCKINIEFHEITANAKSMLSILGACVKTGDEIELVCNGPDEETALAELLTLIENGLGEEC